MRLHRFENVRLENVAVPPIFVQSQHFQCLAVLEAIADDPADDAVRGAEGDPPFRQIVRDVRRAGEISPPIPFKHNSYKYFSFRVIGFVSPVA